jgi:hypothetical protein
MRFCSGVPDKHHLWSACKAKHALADPVVRCYVALASLRRLKNGSYLDIVSLIEDHAVELDLVNHASLLMETSLTPEALLLLSVH